VFNTMRIRAKLVLALAVPLLVVVVLAGVVVRSSAREADAAATRNAQISDQVALATSALGPQGVLGALQVERNAEALYLAGALDSRVEDAGETDAQVAPDEARRQTDVAARQFNRTIAQSTEAVRTIFQPAVAALTRIDQIRAGIDSSDSPRQFGNPATIASFTAYTEIIETIFDANSQVALAVDDASLRNSATMIDITARNREIGTVHTYELVVSLVDSVSPTQLTMDQIREINGRVQAGDELLLRSAVGPHRQMAEEVLADERTVFYRRAVEDVMNGDVSQVSVLIGPAVSDVWSAWTEIDQKIADQLNADAAAMQATAAQEAQSARDRQRNVAGLAGFGVFAALVVALMASRSIGQPLRRLATEAEEMAEHRLPEMVKGILATPPGEDVVVPELAPVDTSGGVEIGEVAEALNAVQTSAADLAVEQAVMRRNIADSFVNLGRRNQNLLSRQIDSITRMEQDAADPDILERLFALDHLATRMRRNAESLLLLGGLDPHRQWSQAVPLNEVIRGALGEVEDYQRVEIREMDDALVKGSAAADVTHMLAELLENALRFSPPGRPVEIVGRCLDEDYSLAIVDAGVGMGEADLAMANRRLAGDESYTVAPSRYLGLYVVGIQAARLGITVRLQPSPGQGVTARIVLGDVLVQAPDKNVHPSAAAPDPAGELTTHASGEPDGSAPTDHRRGHTFVEEPEVERFVPLAPSTNASATGGGEPGDEAETASAEEEPDRDEIGEVAASSGLADLATSTGVEPAVTASGYKRRRRGTHTPRTEVAAAHRGQDGESPPDDDSASTAESVRNLLSGLQAGAERARTEHAGPGSTKEEDS
jgi:signal transduction histidine kinase